MERIDPSNGAQRLGQAISGYLSTIPLAERESTARELGRFARWLGTDTVVSQISPVDVSRYQEQFPESSVDVNARLQPVKSFLTSLKSQKLTPTNLVFTSQQADNFDIYLPLWLARYNKTIFGMLFIVNQLIVLGCSRMTRCARARQPEGSCRP